MGSQYKGPVMQKIVCVIVSLDKLFNKQSRLNEAHQSSSDDIPMLKIWLLVADNMKKYIVLKEDLFIFIDI